MMASRFAERLESRLQAARVNAELQTKTNRSEANKEFAINTLL